ncbi:MAG: molybdenum ABC transporter permease subunit [Planctomycetia bacterium TMED53]|nr:MAG: molybdenum ABC transporter permease subunit [Planctomycetia bacterium TMED53]
MSKSGATSDFSRIWGLVAGIPLLLILLLPGLALVISVGGAQVWAAFSNPVFAEALAVSLSSSLISILMILIAGTPLAWWLARSSSRFSRFIEPLLDLPVVMPPAVIGIGLLLAFGRNGIFGQFFDSLGWTPAFSFSAVVIAQVVIAAPFYLRAAIVSFRNQDQDLEDVARTLGHSPSQIFFKIVLPLSRPGLVAGGLLSWGRALGEFGATLLFAGNMPGVTQTLPLAIFSELEKEVHLAIALSLLLFALAVILLGFMRRFENLKERVGR